MRKGRPALMGLLLGACALISLPTGAMAGNSQVFPETGQTSQNAFYDFWLAHGQTEILGLPLSPTYTRPGDSLVVQLYERAVLQWHPENQQEFRVQLELLGGFSLNGVVNSKGEKDGDRLRAVAPRPCNAGGNCETFTATNHTVQGVFRDYWLTHGGLVTFGYPLTEEFPFTNGDGSGNAYTTQYFERNRLEYHPEINGGTILLGRLAAPIWERDKAAIQSGKLKNVIVPDYTSTQPYINP